jgi:hypothetical protein
MLKKAILLLAITFLVGAAIAQQQNLPLNWEFGLVNQKVFNGFGSNVHTSFLPINESMIRLDSVSGISKSEEKYYLINVSKCDKKPRPFFKWMSRTLFHDNFLVVDTGNLYLTVSPQYNIELGKDSEDNSGRTLYKNTRGVMVRANVGKKFSLETSLYENQAVLPEYLTDYANATEVIPGQGRWKKFKSNQGYDFSSAAANISYSPADYINFQLGTGKHFVGDGYRSLLLSDASFNYPFWKITTTFGKNNQFQYTKLNASLSSVMRREDGSTPEALFQRKTMSTHYFSWIATKWLHFGLFESTLWQTEDSNGTKPLQYQQFNPIIGINTATTGFNDVNHTVVGTNLKIKLPFKTILYNQFVYDGGDKYGYQAGIRYFGINNLTLQLEYNHIAPSTYSSETRLQTYSNYNEPLAHPLGASLSEMVGILNYKFKRLFLQVKGTKADYKFIGNSIFIPESTNALFNNGPLANTELSLLTIQAHIGFLINPKNNMALFVGMNKRSEDFGNLFGPGIMIQGGSSNQFIMGPNPESNYIYVGFRTALRNLYDDF